MDRNRESNTTPSRLIAEFSTSSYSSIYKSIKTDAEAYATNVIRGDVGVIEAVKPVISGTSYIDWKIGSDPNISQWDKRLWKQVYDTGHPDDEKAEKIISSVLRHIESSEGVIENIETQNELLRTLEADLVEEGTSVWKINAATRQDIFYRFQLLREVVDIVSANGAQNQNRVATVGKTMALAPNIRYIQGELSHFLTQKRPTVKSTLLNETKPA